MTRSFVEDQDEFGIRLTNLHSLEDANISGAELAHRELDQEWIATLVVSGDPWTLPPILITRTEQAGYVVIDGYHRIEAVRLSGMDEIRAICKTFTSENEIIEARFEANMHHGLDLSPQNRSQYAVWLHQVYPDIEAQEIARRTGIKLSSVSQAISRREPYQAKSIDQNTNALHERNQGNQHEYIRRDCEQLIHDAGQLFQDISTLTESEQRAALARSVQSIEDRNVLFKVAVLLEQSLR